MFVGAVPRPVIEQIARVVPFAEWGKVFVGCSGSFRFDRAVKAVHPSVTVYSNDISLLSCALGALATSSEFPITFTGRLAFIETALADQPFVARVAAVQVALEIANYRGANAFAVAHFKHYQERFAEFLAPAIIRLEAFTAGLVLGGFHAGDFREQARRAAEVGGGVVAFPPTYKNGYERLYKFLDQNTDWPRPAYDVWDPARIEDWIDELDAMGVRYCVLTDHLLERHEPTTAYRSNINKPIFTFADKARTSLRRADARAEPFRYTALDPAHLTARSTVQVIVASSAQMNFLKNIYLSKNIAHARGLANFLVLIDGNLAGGFIYARNRFSNGKDIYLLSDFALAPNSRVSKLIAMLATSEAVLGNLEIKLMQRIEAVLTTAFTTRPVSMKYRGVFELTSRKPGMLNYASQVRHQSCAEIYADWFRRFAANSGRASPAGRARSVGEERQIHEGRAVQPAG